MQQEKRSSERWAPRREASEVGRGSLIDLRVVSAVAGEGLGFFLLTFFGAGLRGSGLGPWSGPATSPEQLHCSSREGIVGRQRTGSGGEALPSRHKCLEAAFA